MTLITTTYYGAFCDLCKREYKYKDGNRETLHFKLTKAGWTFGLREHWCGKCSSKHSGSNGKKRPR